MVKLQAVGVVVGLIFSAVLPFYGAAETPKGWASPRCATCAALGIPDAKASSLDLIVPVLGQQNRNVANLLARSGSMIDSVPSWKDGNKNFSSDIPPVEVKAPPFALPYWSAKTGPLLDHPLAPWNHFPNSAPFCEEVLSVFENFGSSLWI